jgi:hypothetical protein
MIPPNTTLLKYEPPLLVTKHDDKLPTKVSEVEKVVDVPKLMLYIRH